MNEHIRKCCDGAGLDSNWKPGFDSIYGQQLEKFAELIAEECASMCMSQADRKNIRHAFGIPVESQVKYPGPDPHNSITSQYDRPYNLPRGVTNENLGTS